MVINKKAKIYAFVIMPNHIHIVWSPLDTNYDLGASFKSYTGNKFLAYLKKYNPHMLRNYLSTQNDRKYNFWKRRSRSIEIMSGKIAEQKIQYIHSNPLQNKWLLVEKEEDYFYSSSAFYNLGKNDFGFLSRFKDWI